MLTRNKLDDSIQDEDKQYNIAPSANRQKSISKLKNLQKLKNDEDQDIINKKICVELFDSDIESSLSSENQNIEKQIRKHRKPNLQNLLAKRQLEDISKKQQQMFQQYSDEETSEEEQEQDQDEKQEQNVFQKKQTDYYEFKKNIIQNFINDALVQKYVTDMKTTDQARSTLKKFSENIKFSIFQINKSERNIQVDQSQILNNSFQSNEQVTVRKQRQTHKKKLRKQISKHYKKSPKKEKKIDKKIEIVKKDQIPKQAEDKPVVQVINKQNVTEIRINLKKLQDSIEQSEKQENDAQINIFLDKQITSKTNLQIFLKIMYIEQFFVTQNI